MKFLALKESLAHSLKNSNNLFNYICERKIMNDWFWALNINIACLCVIFILYVYMYLCVYILYNTISSVVFCYYYLLLLLQIFCYLVQNCYIEFRICLSSKSLKKYCIALKMFITVNIIFISLFVKITQNKKFYFMTKIFIV